MLTNRKHTSSYGGFNHWTPTGRVLPLGWAWSPQMNLAVRWAKWEKGTEDRSRIIISPKSSQMFIFFLLLWRITSLFSPSFLKLCPLIFLCPKIHWEEGENAHELHSWHIHSCINSWPRQCQAQCQQLGSNCGQNRWGLCPQGIAF